MTHKVLVTGCARSGTLYTTKVLRAVGLKVGHEYTDIDGTCSHFYATRKQLKLQRLKQGNGRLFHVGEKRAEQEFEVVLHQVRHPIKVIDSLRFTGVPIQPLEAVAFRSGNKVRDLMLYWYFWNKEAEKIATYRYRIEDFPQEWEHISRLLGLGAVELPDVPTDTHHSRRWNNPYGVKLHGGGFVPAKERKRIIQATPPITPEDLRSVDAALYEKIVKLAKDYGYAEGL